MLNGTPVTLVFVYSLVQLTEVLIKACSCSANMEKKTMFFKMILYMYSGLNGSHDSVPLSCTNFDPSPPPPQTQDNDNRVRALSHKALKTCAVAVKSSLAPHLKSIIGSWVSGMCDPHAPAATAAKLAFDEAFHSKKQNEVMEFGFKAIFQVCGKRFSFATLHSDSMRDTSICL